MMRTSDVRCRVSWISQDILVFKSQDILHCSVTSLVTSFVTSKLLVMGYYPS